MLVSAPTPHPPPFWEVECGLCLAPRRSPAVTRPHWSVPAASLCRPALPWRPASGRGLRCGLRRLLGGREGCRWTAGSCVAPADLPGCHGVWREAEPARLLEWGGGGRYLVPLAVCSHPVGSAVPLHVATLRRPSWGSAAEPHPTAQGLGGVPQLRPGGVLCGWEVASGVGCASQGGPGPCEWEVEILCLASCLGSWEVRVLDASRCWSRRAVPPGHPGC